MKKTNEHFDVVWQSRIRRTLQNIKKGTARLAIAVVMTAVVAVPAASALTSADVELLIALGIIPADKVAAARAAVSTTNNTVSCGPFMRNITIGSTGSDVVSLQTFLESKGHLVMPVGVSKGYFGPITRTALASYQASVGIAPAAGYFGPITRANLATACSVVIVTPSPTDPNPILSGDEASLESYDFSSGDDSDVEEDESADIAEIEFDVEDGDVLLDRVDLAFENADGSDRTDPWDALEEVELVIDGKVVGSADLSDEDDYLDEDDGIVRISGINYKIDEGDTVTIIVRVTAQRNVDSDDRDTFEVYVVDNGIRATDALGIQQYIGDDSERVSFDVVEAGEGEELNVSSSRNDPDATTLKVETNKKSDMHTIFVFDVEAEESDIEIDRVRINIETSATTSNMISDLVLEIDGEEFDDWRFVSGGNGVTTRVVEFDIDGDFTIDADDEVEFALMAEFKAANGSNYDAGETIEASIDDGYITGEGADDVDSDGTASGETHTLATEGIVIPKSGFSDEGSTSNNDANTSRDYRFEFEVTAFEEDFYIATSSVDIFVEGAGSATYSYTVDSSADEDTADVFTVEEGDTETFTVIVTVSNVSTSGQYRVGLDSVEYTANSNGVTGTVNKDVNNSDFRTAYRTINN